ncbi:PepSY domain-containing protein [Micromonospora sp. NBC_01392]|uniref:PepSY domain-containing protein n=1 Tax=Micromonospora sp. NBC_01392 TaxID=2903588 RepID=UPI0032469C2B
MRRTSLMLAAAGGVAVLAVTGAALGTTAADRSTGRTAPAAVTVEDNPARTGAGGEDNPARTGTGGEDNPARSATGGGDDRARRGTADDDRAPAGTGREDNPARRGTDDDAGPARAAGGTVSRQRAAEVALARTGGGRVTEIEAETEHGRPAWSVKVTRDGWRHEVKVDRATGAVLEAERQRAGTDDRSGRDDHGSHDRDDDHGRHGDDD